MEMDVFDMKFEEIARRLQCILNQFELGPTGREVCTSEK
jgi:hypothetical protein